MRRSLSLAVSFAFLVASPLLADVPSPTRLEVVPAKVTLKGPGATQRVVVLGWDAFGKPTDLTASASYQVANRKTARLDGRRLLPVSDGETRLSVRVGGLLVQVPVAVSESSRPREVSFRHEIEPTLTKLGCNQGACHGSQFGKGGFRLSLLGFEPDFDYTQIVKSSEARRLTLFDPTASLLLRKPTLEVAHGGGKKLAADSREYELIRLWLEQGAPGPRDSDATVTALEVFPRHRILEPGAGQELVAMATLSDGTVRDVTDAARFDSLSDGIAKVTPAGRATTVGKGETNIMVRYQGHAAMARLTVPYADIKPFAWAENNLIDAHAARKWRELGLTPSAACEDHEFLRRAMLDAIGTTPTPEEIDAFLRDTRPDKRERLVDALLDRPEYVDFWTLKWGDILRVNSDKLGAQGMLAFNLWLRESFRANKPLDRMVNELVTAQGSIYTNGPANFFRVASGPDDLAETTAQVFMGVRLQCAKCHHHPFEAYGQDDYYGLAAYFARIKTKNSDEFGIFGREQVIYVARNGEVRQPRSGKVMTPRPLNARPSDDPVDRRRALSNWLVAADNPWLAKNVVNRYWGYLFGIGLVNPIDDLRETNPPTNPDLMDALAKDFREHKYDLKHLLKQIIRSRVYQLSALPTPDNRLDSQFFSHRPLKRLTAEQLLDAVNYATGTTEKFTARPVGTRAIALPDTSTPSYFLDTFGRPERAIACECERSADPTLSQALHLMNGDLINRKVSQADGRLAKLLKDKSASDESLIETLYIATFCRRPTPDEIKTAKALIADAPKREQGAQDLFWGLLNSKEFLFNH